MLLVYSAVSSHCIEIYGCSNIIAVYRFNPSFNINKTVKMNTLNQTTVSSKFNVWDIDQVGYVVEGVVDQLQLCWTSFFRTSLVHHV